ncbi:MAG TPA: peptidoglycan DD-metalloendopeptidase family protein [Bacteroidales bacterium]|nr:peptidoglycan DD-metalloendopeptidase family protein [Bacteroidales bacterium]
MLQFYTSVLCVWFLISCGNATTTSQQTNPERQQDVINIMDSCLTDGFDYPVGDRDGKGEYISKIDGKHYSSWYNATKFAEQYTLGIHPGIDLNGTGGGDTDWGQPVYAIGKGTVEVAKDFGSPWGNVVSIKHKYIVNGLVHVCYSLYAHLETIQVSEGDFVQKRKQIGEIGTGGGRYAAHLHLEIRNENMKGFPATYWPSSHSKDTTWVKEHYLDPEEFIHSHRTLSVPLREPKLIVAIKSKYVLYYFENGVQKKQYEIALSQNPTGHKEKEGDLKLPEGEYYICGKQKGPFYGSFADFLGPCLLRISYPNIFDAEAAFCKGLLSRKEKEIIVSANLKHQIPPKNTRLGGGIVIHGWKGDWINSGNRHLTWGCISMHNNDLKSFYDIITLNTKIIITP